MGGGLAIIYQSVSPSSCVDLALSAGMLCIPMYHKHINGIPMKIQYYSVHASCISTVVVRVRWPDIWINRCLLIITPPPPPINPLHPIHTTEAAAAMKNGFVVSQDLGHTNSHSNHNPPPLHQLSNGNAKDYEDHQTTEETTTIHNVRMASEGIHVRRLSSANKNTTSTMERPLSPAKGFAGAQDAFSTYDVLWCRTKNWIQAMRHVPWKNSRAKPGRAYTPTEVSWNKRDFIKWDGELGKCFILS